MSEQLDLLDRFTMMVHGTVKKSDQEASPTAATCTDNCPSGWTGHWREYHRGHGCDKDPGPEAQPSIDERFEAFAKANHGVLLAALDLAREWLSRGDKYISVKAIYEHLRTRRDAVHGDGGYKLNNDFTSCLARWLVEREPALEGVIRMRERKS